MIPRHIPPRRPRDFWEQIRSWGIFGIVVVLLGIVVVLGIISSLAYLVLLVMG